MARRRSGFSKDDRDRSPSDRAGAEVRAGDSKEPSGLCATCAKRDTCLLPQAEGGVWHCEEYVEEG